MGIIMKRIKHLLNLMSDLWPFFGLIAILVVHIIMIRWTNINKELIHNVFGQGLPLIGGVIVLLSLNKDVLDFRNQSILSFYKNRLKSHSLKRRDYVMGTVSGSVIANLGKIRATVRKQSITPEEKLNEVDERLEKLSNDLSEIDKRTNNELSNLRSELNFVNETIDEKNKQVSQLLDEAIIGNIDYHFFGVLLIFYGFVLNIIMMY